MTSLVVVLLHLPTVLVLRDAFRFPLAAWRRAGIPRPAWVVIQVLLGSIGAVIYVTSVRPKVAGALDRG